MGKQNSIVFRITALSMKTKDFSDGEFKLVKEEHDFKNLITNFYQIQWISQKYALNLSVNSNS